MKKRKKKRVLEYKFVFDLNAQYHQKDFGRVIRNLQAAGYETRHSRRSGRNADDHVTLCLTRKCAGGRGLTC